MAPWPPDFIDGVSSIPGREWHPVEECWSVPIDGGGAFDLKRAYQATKQKWRITQGQISLAGRW